MTSRNVWQEVIDQHLVLCELGVAKDSASYLEARTSLENLIDFYVDSATNPETNGGYSLVKVEE